MEEGFVRKDRTEDQIARTHLYTAEQSAEAAIAQARLAHRLLDDIIQQLKPGVRESEIKQYALDLFAKNEIEKIWHPPYVRFGKHTLLTFMDKAQEDLQLSDDDIAFVDIGIVQNGIEGDAGRTVVFGENKSFAHLAEISRAIFEDAVAYWQKNNPVGIELYNYIYGLADKAGVAWNLDPAGHLIGAFPHKGWKRGINHFPEKIDSGKWILEIQIRHKELPYGAFFEDLLRETP